LAGRIALSGDVETQHDDPYNLKRFVDAQSRVFEQALSELRMGEKRSHWMWFVFPQIVGLGRSETARRFAIASRDEAKAYLRSPVLGPRLRQCARTVCLVEGRSAHDIFNNPDEMKFHSSMTLFANVAADKRVFEEALEKYFRGRPDILTLRKLAELGDGVGETGSDGLAPRRRGPGEERE
jgi:uncharacterized protein (DUF1810 family)